MWPFGRKKVAARLAAASGGGGAGREPVSVSVLTTIVSPGSVVSPLTGMHAAMILVEVLERIPLIPSGQADQGDSVSDVFNLLGVVVLGDVVTLRDDDGDEINVVVGRAQLAPQLPRRGGTPVTRVPPEIVPILGRATGRGVVCYRELTLGQGEKVRLKAVVEPSQSVVMSGYRSGTRVTYVARDDLAPVVLEEVFEAPSW